MADDLVASSDASLPRRHQAAARRLKELEAQFRLARDPRARALIADVLVPAYVTAGETGLADEILSSVGHTEDAEVDARIAALRGIVAAMNGDDPSTTLKPALDLLPMIPESTAALVHSRAGVAYFFARRAYEAEQHSLQALWVADASGMRWLAARTASVLYGIQYHLTGDLQAARYYAEVQGVEAVAAGDDVARRIALHAQFDLAVTFGEWDRAAALRSLLRRETFNDVQNNAYAARIGDCLLGAHAGDFATMRGIIQLALDAGKETADFALCHGLLAVALAALRLDDEARSEARRALALSREKSKDGELSHLTVRRRLGGVLAAYACALIGDFSRANRALAARAKFPGSIGALAKVLARSILADDNVEVNDPVLQSIKGFADVVVAASRARERLSPASHRAVETLTDTELVLLRSVASGKSNGQIAKERGVSRNAVERRLMSAYGKLGVRTRAEAVAKLNPTKN